MKTYARHLTARLFGRTRMGGLYLYWTFGKYGVRLVGKQRAGGCTPPAGPRQGGSA
ncbi:hypothetical protein ACQP2Y_18675 [Actinoplanes sp. CA-051413]|uniref:hypothetical protein n=1 Tax=Actinoplanes sp. CA-051413 TaxID=3239899 RepID=UPI003D99DF96